MSGGDAGGSGEAERTPSTSTPSRSAPLSSPDTSSTGPTLPRSAYPDRATTTIVPSGFRSVRFPRACALFSGDHVCRPTPQYGLTRLCPHARFFVPSGSESSCSDGKDNPTTPSVSSTGSSATGQPATPSTTVLTRLLLAVVETPAEVKITRRRVLRCKAVSKTYNSLYFSCKH